MRGLTPFARKRGLPPNARGKVPGAGARILLKEGAAAQGGAGG
jgi:hypothetical protein